MTSQTSTGSAAVNARSDRESITLDSGPLTVRYTLADGTLTARRGKRVFLAEGRLVEKDPAGGTARAVEVRGPLGTGRAVEVTWPDGRVRRVALYDGWPFLFAGGAVRNATGKPVTVANVTPLAGRLDAGAPAAKLRGFGPQGPYTIAGAKTQFCFAAAAEPDTRAGIVCGWVTHHRGSGVVTMGLQDGRLTLSGESQYGRLLVPGGQTAEGEVLAVGLFDDCLAGLEAYARACAKAHRITLPARVPSGYCTWYHARASDQKRLGALAEFAGKHLKPFGFDFVQIDDGWQIRGRDFTTRRRPRWRPTATGFGWCVMRRARTCSSSGATSRRTPGRSGGRSGWSTGCGSGTTSRRTGVRSAAAPCRPATSTSSTAACGSTTRTA